MSPKKYWKSCVYLPELNGYCKEMATSLFKLIYL